MPSGRCSKERAKASKERPKAKALSKAQKVSKAKRKEMSRASKAKEKGSSKDNQVQKVSILKVPNSSMVARVIKEDQRVKANPVNIAVETIIGQINAGFLNPASRGSPQF